jgi:hypothetical protein
MDSKRLSRRQLGLLAAVSAAPAAAQQPAAAEVDRARGSMKRAGEALRKVKVPQLLEPSFSFRP